MSGRDSCSLYAVSGYSLVELLIAMGLGAFLMLGLVQVYLATSVSSSVVSAQVVTQSNARYALHLLKRHIRMAGYKSDVLPLQWGADIDLQTSVWRATEYPAGGISGEFESEAVVFAENRAGGPDGESDILHLRLQGEADGSVTGCDGTVIGENVWVQQTFQLSAAGDLLCSLNGGAPVPLSVGLESFQLLFGLSIDPTAPTTANEYYNADDVLAGRWNDVVLIRVALLAASEEAPLGTAVAMGPFDLLDYTTSAFSDGRVRAPYEDHIRLRNRQLDSVL